ncbi:MAG: transposase [Candidatus Competibacteraceae bacterium]|nr:transposase [Candidatus Competibacteraceae bacterium]
MFSTPYDRGNGENTVLFIQHLQALNKDKKLIIIWDGASYHCCKEVQDYLNKINGEVEEKNWKVTFILFEPNAPDQNPVEDVWLRGKIFYENIL